ncbi:MAG: TVP38/TMEM64 family protein [Clostridia bacterium]|nr:TVP38/TMEM64 family protein [Clostridia bacterium]
MDNVTQEKEKNEKTEKNKTPLMILVFFLLTAAAIALGIICLYNTETAFIQNHLTLFIILAVLLGFILCGLGVWFTSKKKTSWVRLVFSVYIFLLFCLVVLLILQKTGFFRIFKTSESMQEYLEKSGGWMPIVYILLQYLQVVVLPIPSVVSTLAGVALFGPFKATLYSLVGILLGSFTAFFIGRKLGAKAVEWIIGKETMEKWQRRLKGKDNLVLTMMFVLPLFPDDVLCFLAGLSSMTNLYFTVMVIISRILTVSVTCFAIDLIPLNTWWGIMIWAIFFVVVIGGFILVYKKLDKIQAWIKKRKENRKKEREEKL